MSMRIIVAVGLLTLSTVGFAAPLDLVPYHTQLSYSDNSMRQGASASGLYLSGSLGEASVEQTLFDYRDGTQSSQNDYTLVWRHITPAQRQFRLGVHGASADRDPENDGKVTFISEYVDYSKDVWGGAFYYTHYKDDTVVQQFSPKFGRYSWLSVLPGTFYFELQPNLINVRQAQNQWDYYSMGADVSWLYSGWQVELGAWSGKQRSAVSYSGFTVYSLSDTYQSDLHLSAAYKFGESSTFKLGTAHRRIEESSAAQTSVDLINLSLSYHF